jgi:hypothetical protein
MIPATETLKQALDDEVARMTAGNVVALDAARDREVISETTGCRYKTDRSSVNFQQVFRRIARAAGIPGTLQFAICGEPRPFSWPKSDAARARSRPSAAGPTPASQR